jgi:hypothetical protein
MVDNASQQLFDLWKRQFEESVQSWATLMRPTAPPADPAAFWRPMFDQAVQTWARIFAQTSTTPDVMTQWKQFVDQSIEAWSKALGQVMGTEAFAQLLGRSLDQLLAAQAPIRKAAERSVEEGLQALGLPSRAQVAGVAGQVADLEDRIERLEDALRLLLRRLGEADVTSGDHR